MKSKVKPIPDGYHTVTAYLVIKGAANALEFYKKAFGATELFRMETPNKTIGHAEIKIGDSNVMLAEECPEMACRSPGALGGTPVFLHLYVEDVDTFAKKAVNAGAKMIRPLENKFYGDRACALADPFGHMWYVATHVEDVPPAELKKRAEASMKKKN